MKIDFSGWKEFEVGKLFECTTTKPMIVTETGIFPYVTRRGLNNGVSDYVADVDYAPNKGNCITVGAEGKVAFYQNKDFISGVKIYTLRHRELNQYNALFICTVLNVCLYKYNYGRARILRKIKKETIKIPINSQSSPDWDFMENYIKSLNHKPITTAIPAITQPQFIHVEQWGEFALGELFTISVSKDKNLFNCDNGGVPYVASSSENNGITGFVDANSSQKSNTLTIARNGSVGSTFYQPHDYCSSPDDIRILTPKFKMNVYIGLFLKTIELVRELTPSLEVDYTANQRHSQTITFTAVAVSVCRNFEHFDLCVDVFNQNTFAGNAPVF